MNYRFKWMGKKEGSDADDLLMFNSIHSQPHIIDNSNSGIFLMLQSKPISIWTVYRTTDWTVCPVTHFSAFF